MSVVRTIDADTVSPVGPSLATRGLTSAEAANRLLVAAIAFQAFALVAFLLIPPLASMLGQSLPPMAGLVIALFAAPSVLLVDWLHKLLRSRRSGRNSMAAARTS